MKMKKLIFIVLGIGICLNCFAVEHKTMRIPRDKIQRLADVVATLHYYYIKPIKNDKLFDDAIRGMLSRLDPHSSFLDEKDLVNLRSATTGKFTGIGVTIAPYKGLLRVISPIDDTPAQKAGIKAGDIIFKVNDTFLENVPINKAIEKIRGKKGTKVVLYVLRKDTPKPVKLTVTRDTIDVPSVKEKLYDHYYGYIRITYFHKPTKAALINAYDKLQKQSQNKLRGLVIDLRNNPGGLLQSSIDVTDLFLPKNKLVVYTKGRDEESRKNYKTTKNAYIADMPIIILINQGSASASEIVAGALQDHHKAIVLGTRSFGKGSVQTVIPIDKKSALKLTTSLYYTPKGREIQAKGIEPDVIVANLSIPKNKAEALLFDPIREADFSNHIKNGSNKLKINKLPTDPKLMHKDFQLYEALNLLKGLAAKHLTT